MNTASAFINRLPTRFFSRLFGWLLIIEGVLCLFIPLFIGLITRLHFLFGITLPGAFRTIQLYYTVIGDWGTFVYLGGAFAGPWLIYLGRRLSAPLVHEVLGFDRRPPVLYLRSFLVDDVTSSDGSLFTNLWNRLPWRRTETDEERITRFFSDIGPVIAIGDPRESIPQVGAARMYVGDDWQARVGELIAASRLVVLRVGDTPGFLWEVATCAAEDRRKLLFLLPSDSGAYDRFRAVAERHFACPFPPFAPEDGSPRGIAGILVFMADGSPVSIPFGKGLTHLGTPPAGLEDRLAEALRFIPRDFGQSISYQREGFSFRRLAAFLTDALLFGGTAWACINAFPAAPSSSAIELLVLPLLLILSGVPAFCEWWWGATPGKMLFSLSTRMQSGVTLSLRSASARTVWFAGGLFAAFHLVRLIQTESPMPAFVAIIVLGVGAHLLSLFRLLPESGVLPLEVVTGTAVFRMRSPSSFLANRREPAPETQPTRDSDPGILLVRLDDAREDSVEGAQAQQALERLFSHTGSLLAASLPQRAFWSPDSGPEVHEPGEFREALVRSIRSARLVVIWSLSGESMAWETFPWSDLAGKSWMVFLPSWKNACSRWLARLEIPAPEKFEIGRLQGPLAGIVSASPDGIRQITPARRFSGRQIRWPLGEVAPALFDVSERLGFPLLPLREGWSARRGAALLADLIIIGGLSWFLARNTQEATAALLIGAGFFLGLMIICGIETWTGRSPGKYLLGLRVLDRSGRPATAAQCLTRSSFRFFAPAGVLLLMSGVIGTGIREGYWQGVIFLPILLMGGYMSLEGGPWTDQHAGTIVVKER